jgi:hypothetical protein
LIRTVASGSEPSQSHHQHGRADALARHVRQGQVQILTIVFEIEVVATHHAAGLGGSIHVVAWNHGRLAGQQV